MRERLFGRYRELVLVTLLLIVPFVVYLSNAKDPRDHNLLDQIVLTISAPVQWIVTGAMSATAELWTDYVYLVGVEERNLELAIENAELRAALASREEQRLENERLRLLFGVREAHADLSMELARVIATSPDSLFRSVRIDRGSSAGVAVGAPVITNDGAVGRVVTVAAGFSDVMLLTDTNFSTDVIVQRTRARARIRGAGSDNALGIRVEQMARTADVEPGDVLITSGTGRIFPKGVRVGTVVASEKRAFGLFQNAGVEPTVDFSRLEEVLVVTGRWELGTSFEVDPSIAERDALSPMMVESKRGPLSPWRADEE